MKALIVEKNGGVSVRNVPQPIYNEYEALVKVHASSVCGTDMKILHNKLKGFSDYPTILGHEGVGEVVEIGKKVRNLKVGDKVVCPMTAGKVGEFFSTWGAMAEYSTAGDSKAMIEDGIPMNGVLFNEGHLAQLTIPSEMDSVAATMIVTFREVYSTVKRLDFKKGQSIVIYGAGPVGLTFLRFVRLMGMSPIVCVDIDDSKINQAKQAGADYVFNSAQCDVKAEIRGLFPVGVDVLLDAAGVPALINQNVALVRNFGKVCVYGVTPVNELNMNWQDAPYSFDLRFAQWPSKQEEAGVHDEIVRMMQRGDLNGMDYISDVIAFDRVLEAMELFKLGKNSKKIALKF